MFRTCRKLSAGAVALVASVVLVGSVFAGPAGAGKTRPGTVSSVSGSMTATAANGTPVARNGAGTVSDSDEDKEYEVCVPYFAKGIEHRYEIKKGNKVVDTFAYVVPAADG